MDLGTKRDASQNALVSVSHCPVVEKMQIAIKEPFVSGLKNAMMS